ncbi:unnamed protein product [Schistocephalus solidus]|uniref:Uncharacterized protein n=1 Tax=Schistocephalus solidus TaxID=70667 RepID=A0A183TTJ2_SCHSO|nr:unnamed protein product [Schistocephalus solidus]
MNYPKMQTTATDTGLPHSSADSSVCHNCDKPVCSAPSKVSFSVACSTHHEDNGDYVIHLDEPILVAGDVRIKIRAKDGVLPKVQGSHPLGCVLLYDAFLNASVVFFIVCSLHASSQLFANQQDVKKRFPFRPTPLFLLSPKDELLFK